jgi:hypothetical protein
MLDTNYSRLQLGQRSPRSYAESAHSNHGRILEVALHPEDGTLPPEQQEAALVALRSRFEGPLRLGEGQCNIVAGLLNAYGPQVVPQVQ